MSSFVEILKSTITEGATYKSQRFLIHVLGQNHLTEVHNIPPRQVVIPVFLEGSQKGKKKKNVEQTETEDHVLRTEMRCISPYLGYLRAVIYSKPVKSVLSVVYNKARTYKGQSIFSENRCIWGMRRKSVFHHGLLGSLVDELRQMPNL